MDASAVLALLNEELGSDKIEAVLDDALISIVNLAEVFTKLSEKGFSAKDCSAMFEMLQIEILPMDYETALLTGSLRPSTKKKGLSLGDRACIATAMLTKFPTLTTDTAWTELKLPGTKITCIR